VAAADLPAVDEAVRLAVAQLLPGGVRKVVFATDNRQLALAQVALPVAGEALTPARKTFWKNRQAPRTVRDAPSANRGGPSAVGVVPSANREVPPTARDGLPAARDGLPTDSDDPPAARDGQPADREALSPAREEALPVSAEALPTARDGRSANRDARPAAEVVRSADRGGRPQSGPSPRSWWASPPAGPGLDDTLVCPLWLEPLAVARPSGGALVLTGSREMLTAARDTLEVLAGQAALALDRISLVEAVGRRDSDLYLRAVIRNTPDAMLVIDSDQRIRYASPALRAMLGLEELPPLATLHDLVHPNDRSQVRQALETEGDGVVFCALQRPDESQVLVEATYRDLREDRLVQGFVVTMRNVTKGHEPGERLPHLEHQDELPAWVNRRSAQHKFRY
jgi:PAS domain S-box-containing protein